MEEFKGNVYDPPSKEQLIDETNRNVAFEMYHIDYFQNLISNVCPFSLLNYIQLQFPEELIDVRPKNIPSFQILYKSGSFNTPQLAVGHFVCVYYDTRNIKIFDSLGSNYLSPPFLRALQQLYPYNFQEKKVVIFPEVQNQWNEIDCAVFSIANATSLLFGKNPEMIEYDRKAMRPHLIQIFRTGIVTPFPHRLKSLTNTNYFNSDTNTKINELNLVNNKRAKDDKDDFEKLKHKKIYNDKNLRINDIIIKNVHVNDLKNNSQNIIEKNLKINDKMKNENCDLQKKRRKSSIKTTIKQIKNY